MTLIIGIRCSNGVVLGADGAATYITADMQPTIRESMTKLHIVAGQAVVGTSGAVGMGQLHADSVEELWQQKAFQRKTANVLRAVHPSMAKDIPFCPSPSLVLLAAPVGGPNGRAELFHWSAAEGAEAATEALPYFSIGSGQPLADPFLAFIRRVFWPEKPPALAEGVFAVAWTLVHSIGVAPGGLGEPIQLITLFQDGGSKWTARVLDDRELSECREDVENVERHLALFTFIDSGTAPPSLAGP